MRKSINLIFALSLVIVTAQAANCEKPKQQKGSSMPAMQMQMHQMNSKMVKMLGDHDANYDLRFIDLMIPHHEGAILMAKDALKDAHHPEIKEMAQKMIDAQQKEIEQLKTWRQQWYKQ